MRDRAKENAPSNITSSQLNEIFLLREIKVVILADELFDLVRVDVVAVDGLAVLVTGDILHDAVTVIMAIAGASVAGVHLAQDACPLPMKELTALGFTDARVAEVRALERMALGALGALFAEAVEAKRPAYESTWRHFGVSIPAVRVGAVILHEMQTSRRPLRRQVVGEIAGVAVCAFAFL